MQESIKHTSKINCVFALSLPGATGVGDGLSDGGVDSIATAGVVESIIELADCCTI